MAFLATNYIVERHREALLWSFIVARSDRDNSQTLSIAERKTLLSEIGFNVDNHTSSILVVSQPKREPTEDAAQALSQVGLGSPMATSYTFTSHESGYAYVYLDGRPQRSHNGKYTSLKPKDPPHNGWPYYRPEAGKVQNNEGNPSCTLDVWECFGGNFLEVEDDGLRSEDLLKVLAFERPRCGDCIISSLLGKSGKRGLSAFLPTRNASVEIPTNDRVALSMSKSWDTAKYDANGGRDRAISLLQRYSYVMGKLPLAS